MPQRYGLATVLHRELREAFAEKPDVAPPRKTSRRQREELAAAKVAIVERKVELGRQLAALRDTVSDNRRFGTAVRRQFDIHNATRRARWPASPGSMARVRKFSPR